MEFEQVSNSKNIYSTLCGNNDSTTFTSEELDLNRVYNDVWKYNDRDIEEQKFALRVNFGDKSRKLDHPSKEFIFSGGLKRVVKEQQLNKTAFQGIGRKLNEPRETVQPVQPVYTPHIQDPFEFQAVTLVPVQFLE